MVTGDVATSCTEAESPARTDACSVSAGDPSDPDLTLLAGRFVQAHWEALPPEIRAAIMAAMDAKRASPGASEGP